MTRLILTSDSSAAGALGCANPADLVIVIERRLVWGRLPSEAQCEAFFAPRSTQAYGPHWLDDAPSWRLEKVGMQGLGLLDLAAKCEAVELCMGPQPNAQLLLLWLLHYWGSKATIAAELVLHYAGVAIAEIEMAQLAKLDLRAVEITRDHFHLASLAWRAYAGPTPQAWFDLLQADLSLLPHLSGCVLNLLEELPSRLAGTGATETRILQLISPGDVKPFDVFPGHEKPNKRRVFDYWETGTLLDGLAQCPVPAVAGLDEGPFSLDMHQDAARLARYKQSRPSLTAFGRAVLAGEEDFARHNPIRWWWGGTHLTNDRLWRWDARSRSLIAP